MAQTQGLKVVMSDLLSETGSRSRLRLWVQKWAARGLAQTLPRDLVNRIGWPAYRLADACLAGTSHEARLMHYLFGAPAEKVHVVPNGVENTFLNSPPTPRGPWLVCTGTITDRKRVLELAEAAVVAQTPVWIVGKPYVDSDPYARRFFEVAAKHPRILRFEGAIPDRIRLAQVYREARGFVLLSTRETRSLSSEEAAACECPLLLSDLPWARSVFQASASYCPITPDKARTAGVLRRFYDAAPTLPPPPKPLAWVEVGRKLRAIYEGLLDSKTS
jgi:glycosyltransferase involved in cell wall biosynthesis